MPVGGFDFDNSNSHVAYQLMSTARAYGLDDEFIANDSQCADKLLAATLNGSTYSRPVLEKGSVNRCPKRCSSASARGSSPRFAAEHSGQSENTDS
jgi:hypothetical protein